MDIHDGTTSRESVCWEMTLIIVLLEGNKKGWRGREGEREAIPFFTLLEVGVYYI